MTRWRLVHEHDGEAPLVSSTVLSRVEAFEQLHCEAMMHSATGWVVTPGTDVIVCRKVIAPNIGMTRTIRAVEFDAMHDHVGVV